MPAVWQPWPNSAACWSPATPAMRSGSPKTPAGTMPNACAEGCTFGRMARGTRRSRRRAPSPSLGGVGERGGGGGGPIAGEWPDEPRVHGAERELPARRALTRARNLVEQPCELGAAEVRVDDEAGALADQALRADLAQVLAQLGGAPVLPHDGVRDRLAGLAVPHDGGFALVRDADGQEIFCGNSTFSERVARHVALRGEDLARVVLHPARARKDLAELALPDGHRAAGFVE